MKTVHQEVARVANSKGGLKAAARDLVMQYGRNRVLEAASDMSFSSADPQVNARVARLLALVEEMPTNKSAVARRAAMPPISRPAALRANPDMQALKTQARQHLSLVGREGKKAAQQAGVLARQAKEVAHDSALGAKVIAMQQAFNSLDLYCEGGKPQSGALDKLSDVIDQRQRSKRGGRSTMRRNPTGEGQVQLAELLALLFSIKNYAWTAHWNAKGPTFYGDHLLLQRIYEKMDKSIDALGERVLAYTGQPVSYPHLTQEMARLSSQLVSPGDMSCFGHLAVLVKAAQQQSDRLRDGLAGKFNAAGTSGLDNYLTDLNDRLDTFGYLLQQRTRG